MSKINGIYAAAVSILDKNLSLDINKTIKHAENLIDQGCHGVVMLGSTGQAQLISFDEKINLIKQSSKSRYKENFIFGTGINSLNDTITFMSTAKSFNFDKNHTLSGKLTGIKGQYIIVNNETVVNIRK